MATQSAVAREVLSWPVFGQASRELAAQVAQSGFRPDMVLAVARGGLTVAGALAYALSVKNCFAMNVEFCVPTIESANGMGTSVIIATDHRSATHARRPQKLPTASGETQNEVPRSR